MLNGIIPELKKDDEQFFPIISCLSRYVFDNPVAVYGMINQIQDRESRLYAVAYVVREHNDYSQPCVLKAYAEAKPQNVFFTVHLLQDAIKSNKEFALKETNYSEYCIAVFVRQFEKQRKMAIMGFQQLKSSTGSTQKIIM